MVSPGMRTASWIFLGKSFEKGCRIAREKQSEHSGLVLIMLNHVCSFKKEGRVNLGWTLGHTACKSVRPGIIWLFPDSLLPASEEGIPSNCINTR